MRYILIGILAVWLVGCSEEDMNETILEECAHIRNATVLAEDEGCCAVFGAAVYRFEGEIYTIQGFCSCNEFLPSATTNPIGCDGIPLCDSEAFQVIQDCLLELTFYEKAEFLFNVIIE